MKAAICIDEWKLSIFTEEFDDAGFVFEKHPGVTEDTLTLSVDTPHVENLAQVVQRACDRCEVEKRKQGMH